MILGEVEYTVWRNDAGKVVSEDSPGAIATSVSEQVRGMRALEGVSMWGPLIKAWLWDPMDDNDVKDFLT